MKTKKLICFWCLCRLSLNYHPADNYITVLCTHTTQKRFWNTKNKIFAESRVILSPKSNVGTIALSRKLLMLTALYELWEPLYIQVLKSHMHPGWWQTPPQSSAIPAIIMGDMSLFIRANTRQSITESHSSRGSIEEFLGDILPHDLFIKTPICLIGDAH